MNAFAKLALKQITSDKRCGCGVVKIVKIRLFSYTILNGLSSHLYFNLPLTLFSVLPRNSDRAWRSVFNIRSTSAGLCLPWPCCHVWRRANRETYQRNKTGIPASSSHASFTRNTHLYNTRHLPTGKRLVFKLWHLVELTDLPRYIYLRRLDQEAIFDWSKFVSFNLAISFPLLSRITFLYNNLFRN